MYVCVRVYHFLDCLLFPFELLRARLKRSEHSTHSWSCFLCIWNTKETSSRDIFVQPQMTDCLILLMLCLLGKLYQGTASHRPEVPDTREQLNHYRNVTENVQSELAAMLVKFECAQSEVRRCSQSPLRSASL